MKKILALCFLLLASFAAQAQKAESPAARQTPPEQLKLRDELEADQSFLKILCSIGRGNKSLIPDAEKENIRIRWLIHQASRAEDKTVKAKFTCSTKEGTQVTSYIIVEKGKTKIIIDASRDEFGSLRVHSYECEKLTVGAYGYDENKKAMIFTPAAKDEKPDGKLPFFQCQTSSPDKSLVF